MQRSEGVVHTFSVVIPLYEKGAHVARALRSVFDQTFQDFEVVVVDDGSRDHGPDVVRKFTDPRLRLIRQGNAGVSAARNRGIAETDSALLAFLDADDAWKPGFLETIGALRQGFPDAGAYCTAYEVCLPDGSTSWPVYRGIPGEPWKGIIPNYFSSALGSHLPVCSSGVVVPREVFRAVGQFPEGQARGEDQDMWCRIALKYPIAFSSRREAAYHQDAQNRACNNPAAVTASRPVIGTLQRALERGEIAGDSTVFAREYIAKTKLDIAYGLLLAGRRREAIGLLGESRTRLFRRERARCWLMALSPRGKSGRGAA